MSGVSVVVDGDGDEIAAVDKVVLSNDELDVYDEGKLELVSEGGTVVVVDVNKEAVVVGLSDGLTSTTVDSDGDGDDNAVVGPVGKGIGDDAFVVGVAT